MSEQIKRIYMEGRSRRTYRWIHVVSGKKWETEDLLFYKDAVAPIITYCADVFHRLNSIRYSKFKLESSNYNTDFLLERRKLPVFKLALKKRIKVISALEKKILHRSEISKVTLRMYHILTSSSNARMAPKTVLKRLV